MARNRGSESCFSYYMQNAAYNPAGALIGATLGLDGANQWTESRSYNSRLQARRVEVAKGANTLLRLRWAYSGAYNSTTLEETGTDNNGDLRTERLEFPHQGAMQTVDRSYAYTGADRLSYFSETSGKSQYFGHDAFGNVWQSSVSGVPSLRQTGSSWYLVGGSTVNNRLANTSYDAMGNQTQLSVSAGTVASYDAENRMAKIAVSGSEIASYTYDAEGRRVAKTAGGATTYYVYDAFGQLMAEYGGPAQTAGTRYFTTDYLGSTRMILNGTGGCVERLDYAPFGGQISRSGQDCYGGASSEKPLYTGQMRDGESTAGTDTGEDYFSARYFWANTARFTSPDAPFADQRPEDGQSWNMYAYVRNNPLRYVDPSGKAFCSVGEGASDAGGANQSEEACATAGGTWVYQPIDTDDPNADADSFRFSTTVTEQTGQLSPTAQTVAIGLERRADASNKGIVLFAGASLVAGAAIAPAIGASATSAPSILIGDVSSSFNFGASVQVASTPINAVRVSSGAANNIRGAWSTTEVITSSSQARTLLALPPSNPAAAIGSVTIESGTTFVSGTAAPLFGQAGGGFQIFARAAGCVFGPVCGF